MSSKPVLSKYLPSLLVLLVFLASYDAVASGLMPSSNITAPTDGSYLPASLGSYSITGSAADNSGTGLKKVEVSIDRGSTWKTAYDASGSGSLTSWKLTWSPLPLGNYSIISKATDNQNGTESPAPGVHVIIDGTPPASTITNPAAGSYLTGTSFTISGTASDTGGSGLARVEISTNGGTTWTAATGTSSWSYNWTPPADGSYTIKSRAVDRATNAEVPGLGITVTVDATKPSSSITSPLGGLMKPPPLGNYSIKGIATDGPGSGVSRVEVSTNGGATWSPASGTSSWTYSWALPADGVYNIKSRATDIATNLEIPSTGVTVEVDGTPPVGSVSINAGSLYTTNRNVTLTLSATDTGPGRTCPGTYPIMCNVAEMQFSLNGTAWNDWEPAATSKAWQFASGDGQKTIYARYKDQAGNVSSPYSTYIALDTVPPSSSITAPAAGTYITSTSFTITGNADDTAGSGVTKVEVSTDGGTSWHETLGTGQWSYVWTPPSDGSYTVKTRATDTAGNIETSGPGVAVIVDRTPPSSLVNNTTAGALINGTTYTFTGTSDDGTGSGISKVEVSTNGGTAWAAAAGTTSWSYIWTTPTDGSYTVKTRAIDIASNTETPGTGIAVTVDKTPPTSTIVAPTAGALIGGAPTYTITGTANDTGAGLDRVEVSTDGGMNWAAASGTQSRYY